MARITPTLILQKNEAADLSRAPGRMDCMNVQVKMASFDSLLATFLIGANKQPQLKSQIAKLLKF